MIFTTLITYPQAIVLGLLQGVSELFPISSLGHSVILPSLLGWDIHQNDQYFLTFLVATHLATALVLLGFFWSDWVRIVKGIGRSLRDRGIDPDDADAKLGWLLVVGTIPAGILGLLLEHKLRAVFAGIAAFKTERKELVLGLIETWVSDHNAVVREKFRRVVVDRMTPMLASIIREGQAQGTFAVSSPDDTARVFVAFILALNQSATEVYLARHAGAISLDDVRRAFDAQVEAMERILGAPSGTITIVDDALLHEWFD